MTELSLAKIARRTAALVAACSLAVVLSGCDPTLGLGLPSTRALEAGAQDSLNLDRYEVAGTYQEIGETWNVDLQLQRPDKEHIVISGTKLKVEAIVFTSQAYFRGQDFLAAHVGTDQLSQNLIKAAGNAWWRGSAGLVPTLPELTNGDAFRRTFLGSAVKSRTDHVAVDGVDTVELLGPRAAVYIEIAAPHRLVRVVFAGSTAVDGIERADLHYRNYGRDFNLTAPTDVIDFSNLSTLPPIYSVVWVDTSGCANPCVVSALIKNLGGLNGAKAPSTITFTMTANATGAVVGSCQAQVVPDVGYNATATVSCTIANFNPQSVNAAVVTATVDNPGRG